MFAYGGTPANFSHESDEMTVALRLVGLRFPNISVVAVSSSLRLMLKTRVARAWHETHAPAQRGHALPPAGRIVGIPSSSVTVVGRVPDKF